MSRLGRTRHHLRRSGVALVLAAVCTLSPAAGALATGPAPVGAQVTAPVRVGDGIDRPSYGSPLPRTGRAAGGWIGSRRFESGVEAYRIDPGASSAPSSYGATHRVRRLVRASLPLPGRQLARAAWVLSDFGTKRSDTEASAVDAAVQHLLSGGPWRLDGRRGSPRITRAKFRADVRRYADYLVGNSALSAGPFRTVVTAGPASAAGSLTLTMRVTAAATGAPISERMVSFRLPGQRPRLVPTDQTGIAQAVFAAGSGGVVKFSATVYNLPEWHLFLRQPRHHGSSRLAVAGKHFRKTIRGTADVAGLQVVDISNSAVVLTTNDQLAGSWSVRGHGGARRATVALFGPYTHLPASGCTGKRVVSSTSTVDEDATFTLPATHVSDPGYYQWAVGVAANPTNQSVVSCGRPVRVQSVPVLDIRPQTSPIGRGQGAVGLGLLSDTDDNTVRTVTSTLYGPFHMTKYASCSEEKVFARFAQQVRGDRQFSTSAAKPAPYPDKSAAYYLWRSVVPGTTFSTPAATKCRAGGTFLKVTYQRQLIPG